MKKIMFNDRYGLTEAVLSGRKTQTRRLIKPQPTFNEMQGIVWRGFAYGLSLQLDEIKGSCRNFITGTEYDKSCNRYRVGEVVAVAQAYKDIYNDERDPRLFPNGAGWTNKMFVKADLMPHQIRITNVRVERLQDISDEDCEKEGVHEFGKDPMNPQTVVWTFPSSPKAYYHPCDAYADLIDKISGKGTWQSNPYVFVYDFELVR